MRHAWIPTIALLSLACGENDSSPVDGGPDYDCSVKCRYHVNPSSAGGDGTTWETAFNRVQPAVDAAGGWTAACHDDCEVWVAQGTYHIYKTSSTDTISLHSGVELYGGFAGTESTLEERDWTTNVATLDGSRTAASDWVLHVITAESSTVVDGFTITNDVDSSYFGEWDDGGRGIYHIAGTMSVKNCVFMRNRAKKRYGFNDGDAWGTQERGSGGAIYSDADELTIEACEFVKNNAVAGGAIYTNSELVVLNSIFDENTASGVTNTSTVDESWSSSWGNGGAIYAPERSLSVSDSSFLSNHSVFGGAVHAAGQADISNTTFQNNSVSGTTSTNEARGGGGAVFLESAASIHGCTFEANQSIIGGAILAVGELQLEGCDLVSNSASAGGAIFIPDIGDAVTILDSRFDGNLATEDCRDHEDYETDCNVGGALATRGKPVVARNCLFTSNTALVGGAVHADTPMASHWFTNNVFYANAASSEGLSTDDIGSTGAAYVSGANSKLYIRNCAVTANTADDAAILHGNEQVTHSLVEGGWEGVGNIDGDPLFVDAEGGDFSLQAGSPCIDAADGEVAPEFDLNGNPRVDDPDSPNTGIGPPWADMGAYEYQPE